MEFSSVEECIHYAKHNYDNPSCVNMQDFEEDLKLIKKIKNLISRYNNSNHLNTRLLLNHIIALANVFGVECARRMLLYYLQESRLDVLKAFLVFLKYMKINSYPDIPVNQEIYTELNRL